jgi:hypothetical protein
MQNVVAVSTPEDTPLLLLIIVLIVHNTLLRHDERQLYLTVTYN